MLTNDIKNKYETWLEKAIGDNDLIQELKTMDEKSISDAFYRDLEFGTGGLRGTIGAGTNRMNIYVVTKASQGLANYINENFKKEDRKVAISRDSRLKSDLFANVAAQVFAANGIKVYIYPYITPVPVLSYAVRYYKCAAGVMITASHNPSQYNGYKVYGSDGCQITTQAAKEILSKIDVIDIFNEVKKISLDDAFEKSLMEYIPPKVLTAFIEDVKKLSVIGDEPINKDFSIVYTPLHGAGLIPVTRILDETGYKNVIVVKEQQIPDGYFLTCPFPNPEIEEAMDLGMKYAEKYNADLLVATDPDCDRVGVAVKDKDNYRLITGNELGILLFNFICERLTANNKMPKNPVACDTIVTTDMGNLVADYYGVKLIRTLTGFKFIGEQIGILEQKGALDSFLFGFEESYGVLSGTHVRDKDAVNGTFLVCEMFAYYKTHGISLVDKLEELYKKFGYHYSTLNFFKFEGQEGFNKMQSLMNDFRNNLTEVAGLKVVKKIDYSLGVDDLPKSNVLKFYLEGDQCCIVRPSGTEPKLKLYITAKAASYDNAKEIEHSLVDYFKNKLN